MDKTDKLDKLEEAVQISLGTYPMFVTCATCKHFYHKSSDWGQDTEVCTVSPHNSRINSVSGKTEYEYGRGQWTTSNYKGIIYKDAKDINPNGTCSKWVHDPHKKLRKWVKRLSIIAAILLVMGTFIFLIASNCDCPKGSL